MKKFAVGCAAAIGVFAVVIVGIALATTIFDFNGTTDTTPTDTTPTQTTPAETGPVETTEPATPIEVEFVDAQSRGLIEYSAYGRASLEQFQLNITSESDDTLEIVILPGTIFDPQAAYYIQSLVVITEKLVLLDPHEAVESLNIDAGTINMQLDTPGEDDSLVLSMTPASGDLMLLLNLPDFQDFDFRIQQFAIWTLTDNPGLNEYPDTGPSDEEIDNIRSLFEIAGIPTEEYRVLQPPVYVELIEAQSMGLIGVSARGTGSINRIQMSLTSNSDDVLEVAILPGTIFISSAAGVQSMVVVAEKLVLLDPYEAVESVNIDAACANMELDAPEESNSLVLSTTPASGDLVLLLNLPEFHDETLRVQQFAVWTITDNPGRGGYMGIATGFAIFGTGPRDEEIERIRVLFGKAGISTDKYQALL